MIWPNSMEKRWFRRFVSLVSLTLGNSVSWGKSLDFSETILLSRAELSDSEGTVFDIHYGDVLIKYGSVLDAEKADVPRIANDAVANEADLRLLTGR